MEHIPFSPPDITEAEIKAVEAAMRSGWITTGPKTREFEKAFASQISVSHAVAVNSCTAAMHVALDALGVGEGDEVILPTLTFAATAEVVLYRRARPVLVDVRPDDHQIDPREVDRAITNRTRAVMPVHFAGQPCEMDAILELARQTGAATVEDAAHSLPVSYKGRTIGAIGDVTCFSFYATKSITTGEGGMATTDDEQLAERMRILSHHGISRDAWKRYSAEGTWYYEIVAPGYKYNMTDIAAAMGLVQLSRIDEMHQKRTCIARRYTEELGGLDVVDLPAVHPDRTHAWHLFVLRLRTEMLTIDRARFIEEMKVRGIATSVHFIPLHLHPFYRDTYAYEPDRFPVALDLYRRSVSLPIFSSMTSVQLERVIGAVHEILQKYRR